MASCYNSKPGLTPARTLVMSKILIPARGSVAASPAFLALVTAVRPLFEALHEELIIAFVHWVLVSPADDLVIESSMVITL